MSFAEFLEQLSRLHDLMVAAGRDPNTMQIYYERVPIKRIDLRDDGSGQDNLDIILK